MAKKKPTKRASLVAMLKALEAEIEKQALAIDAAQQRLANLEADRERLKERIADAAE